MEKVTISDLGATLADITGVPQPTVMMHARRAREAGLLNKKGHGRGAAQMEPSDAAHLLGMIVAAPLAGPSIKHTVENWKRYADLHVRRGPNAPGKWKIAADLDIPQLAALGADHTLFEFLVSVIDAAKSGDLQSEIERLASENHGILIPDVRVTFHAPRCFVRATVNLAGADLAEEKPYGSVAEIVGDLRQIREFGLRTILTVGKVAAMTEEETRALLRNQAICYSAFDRLQDIEPEPFDDMAVVQRLTDGPVEIQWITFPDQPGRELRILYAGVESFVACEFNGCVEIDHVDTATLPEWLPIVLRGSQFEDEIAEHVAACIQRRERLN